MFKVLTGVIFVLAIAITGGGCKPATPPPSLSSIAATPNSLNLTAGGALPIVITARYSDGASFIVNNVTYNSSNTTVATLDADGYVRGGEAGSAIITVSYSERSVSKTIKVPVIVTGIRIIVPGGAHQSE